MSDTGTFPPQEDLPPDDPRRLPLLSRLDRLFDALLAHTQSHEDLFSLIDERTTTIMAALDDLTKAVGDTITAQQTIIDDIHAHATANNDPKLAELASKLQAGVSALSTVHTQMLAPAPEAEATSTVAGGASGATGASGA